MSWHVMGAQRPNKHASLYWPINDAVPGLRAASIVGGKRVGVHLRGDIRVRVSEPRAHGGERHAVREQVRSASVAQAVKRCVADSCLPERPDDRLRDQIRRPVIPVRLSEDQILIFVGCAEAAPMLSLLLALKLKRNDGGLRQGKRTALCRSWGA